MFKLNLTVTGADCVGVHFVVAVVFRCGENDSSLLAEMYQISSRNRYNTILPFCFLSVESIQGKGTCGGDMMRRHCVCHKRAYFPTVVETILNR